MITKLNNGIFSSQWKSKALMLILKSQIYFFLKMETNLLVHTGSMKMIYKYGISKL